MKFGIIVSKGTQRKALPIVEAPNEFAARFVASIDNELNEGWKFESVRDITDFPLWNNCLYSGQAVGHTVGQCTADSCY